MVHCLMNIFPLTKTSSHWKCPKKLYWNNDQDNESLYSYVGSEVLNLVVMKSCIFWDIMLCSLLKVNWSFRGMYYRVCLLSTSWWSIAWLTLWLWRWRSYVPLKHQLTFIRLNGIRLQKTELLIIFSQTGFYLK
jgi:hypothetical protein